MQCDGIIVTDGAGAGAEAKGTIPDVKAKRTRPDIKAKLKSRSTTVETVVKACLLKHTRSANRDKIKKALILRTAAFSRRMHAASLGLLHIIQARFDGVSNDLLGDVALPSFNDQTFIRQLMLGVAGAHQPHADVVALHQANPEYVVNAPRYLGDRNIYSAGAKQYVTNLTNHLRTHAVDYLKRAAYATPDRTKQDCVAVWTMIVGVTPRFAGSYPLRQTDDIFVQACRALLGLAPGTRITDEWLEMPDNLPRLMRLYVYLNRHIAAAPQAKLFCLVPVCKVRAQFVHVDTSVLNGLLKEVGMVREAAALDDTFSAMADAQWKSVFAIDRLEGRNNKFTGTIQTDGVSICAHFKRPMNETDMPRKRGKGKGKSNSHVQYQPQEGDRVLGVDPGRKTIMFIVDVLPDGGVRKYTLSGAQYYSESGIVDARKHTEKWHHEIRGALNELSTVSNAGVGVAGLVAYMIVYGRHAVQLWIAYLRPRWARQRLRLYGGKKRVFANFLNKVAADAQPGQRTVLAYGSAKFAATGPGEAAVPTTRAYKECSFRFVTVPIDEFRTTKTKYKTGDILHKVVRHQPGRRGVDVVRGLLWCSSTIPKQCKFIDRDMNASLNIRSCLLVPGRPEHLQRHPDLEPIVQQIGVRLRR